MYKSDLLKKNSRLNQNKEKKNYDQTLFPRIDKKKFSVYKIAEQPLKSYGIVSYVEASYWEDYYVSDNIEVI